MVKICPVSFRNINQNVSRLNALFTFLFVVGYILSGSIWFVVALIVDFILRLTLEGRINPVIRINVFFLDLLRLPKVMINAGPKIFAARIGLTLAAIGLSLFLVGFNQASYVVLEVLGLFSFLEFAFGLCVACKIYPYALPLNEIKLFR